MHNYLEEVTEKLAEIYQEMVAHAGEKNLSMSELQVEAYLHIAFNAPEN